MKYHNILKDDFLNGDGIRVTLFVSGCTHKCKGCHNPLTWDKTKGLDFDENAKAELFDEIAKDYISGVTLSGGDPLAEFNQQETIALMKEIKEKFPEKNIWVYTGWTKGELERQGIWEEVAKYADVVVDGRYIEKKRSIDYPWAGSTNQCVLRKENDFKPDKVKEEKPTATDNDASYEFYKSCCE